MATEGGYNTTNNKASPPAYDENANKEAPPPYSDNPNTDPNGKSAAISLDDPSTRFTLYSTIFLIVAVTNMTLWGYFMDDSDYCDQEGWWDSEPADCSWLYIKFTSYTLGLVAVILSFLMNYFKILPGLPPAVTMVAGFLLIISGIFAAVGQVLMVNDYNMSGYLYCPVIDISYEDPRTCCFCEPA
eukprot:371150_1